MCPDCVKYEREHKKLNIGNPLKLDEKIKTMREKGIGAVMKSSLTDFSQSVDKLGQAVKKGIKTSMESIEEKKKEIMKDINENKANKEKKKKESGLHDIYRDLGDE